MPRAWLREGVDADVAAAFDASIAALEALGATAHDIDLPHSRVAIPVYYLVATAEASSNLARFDGVRYGFRARERRRTWPTCTTARATSASAPR